MISEKTAFLKQNTYGPFINLPTFYCNVDGFRISPPFNWLTWLLLCIGISKSTLKNSAALFEIRRHLKLKTLTLAVIIGLTSFALMLPINADEMPAGPHLSTTGSANIDVTPDIATITIEASYSAKEAAEAKRQVDKRVSQYFDFLRKNGIEQKDINAANLSTQPEYDYQNGSSELKGFRAVRQVLVTVREIGKLNQLLDGALKLGLNEIQAIKLGLAKPSNYREQVRKKAIQNAILLATSLAEGFKVKLGPIYSIHYQGDNDQSPLPIMLLRAENASKSTPSQTYQQQTIHFKDQVDVVFELQNGTMASEEK